MQEMKVALEGITIAGNSIREHLAYYTFLDADHVRGEKDLFVGMVSRIVKEGFRPYFHALGGESMNPSVQQSAGVVISTRMADVSASEPAHPQLSALLPLDRIVRMCNMNGNRPATPLNDAHQGGCFIFRAWCEGVRA